MSDNPLTDILSGVSAYLSQVIDDRLDQRFTTTVLPPAIREEINRIIDTRINAVVQSPGFDARLRSIIDERAQVLVNTTLDKLAPKRDLVKHEIEKYLENTSTIEDAARDACEEAVDTWMDDTSNVNKLARNMDLEETVDDVLRGGSFEVTFRR